MLRRWSGRGPLLALCLLTSLCFLLGGSARGDVVSLILLRPAALLLLGYGLWGLTLRQIWDHSHLFIVASLIIALTVVHLVPLSPALWQQLPGRELVAEIDRNAGLGALWRPISLSPEATWNALYALVVPLAALVLAVRLRAHDRAVLLPWLIGCGLLSALLALFQIVGPVDGPLYFYRVTNERDAVGLFANRNHQAVFLATMFPLLAAFVSSSHWPISSPGRRAALAVASCAFFIPLIFVSGSRAGFISGVVGLAFGAAIYRKAWKAASSAGRSESARQERGPRAQYPHVARPRLIWLTGALAIVVVLGLSAVTIILGRAEALQRILDYDKTEEIRLLRWSVIAEMTEKYFPAGSGIGSFVPVYRADEPTSLLRTSYLNHAHNDYLEVLMTSGLPGLVLLVYVAALVLARLAQCWGDRGGPPETMVLIRLGVALILLVALASVGDYPLRTPSLSLLFAVAAVWAATPMRRQSGVG